MGIMNKYNYTKAVPGQRPVALDHNQMTQVINAVVASLHIDGIIDSSGFHTKRQVSFTKQLIRKAFCKNDAGAGNTIDCYLDEDATGQEVTVNCSIAQGGTNLNTCLPLLANGDLIFVTPIGNEWWCLQTFNYSKECDCYEA